MPNRDNKPIVCAYYTDNYINEISSLVSSLEHFCIDYYVQHYESRGYWEANTRIKPEFLSECLDRFPGRPIVYLDADAVVRKPLTLFDDVTGDIGVYRCQRAEGFSHNYLTGTLYLSNNDSVKKFIKKWIEYQKGKILSVDQDSFEFAIENSEHLKIFNIPESYVKIFDRNGEEPVIEHFQASRRRVKLQRLLKKARNIVLIVLCTIIILYILLLVIN